MIQFREFLTDIALISRLFSQMIFKQSIFFVRMNEKSYFSNLTHPHENTSSVTLHRDCLCHSVIIIRLRRDVSFRSSGIIDSV